MQDPKACLDALQRALEASRNQGPKELAELVLRDALALTGSSAGWVVLHEPGGAHRIAAALAGDPAARPPFHAGLEGVVEPADPWVELLYDDRASSAPARRSRDGSDVEVPAFAGVPLASVSGALGVLAVEGRLVGYSAADIAVLRALASGLSHALEAQRWRSEMGLLQALVAACPEGLAICDLGGVLTHVNRAFLAVLGSSEEAEVVGWLLPDVAALDPDAGRAVAESIRRGNPWHAECVPRGSGEAPHPIAIEGGPLFDGLGERCGAVIAARDISAQWAAEEQILSRTRDLARSNRELERFATTAARELQEPLRKILAFGEFLLGDCGHRLDGTGRDYLARMLKAAERQQELVDGLLRYARVQGTHPVLGEVDLEQVLRDAIGDLRRLLRETGGGVEVGPMPAVLGDEALLRLLLRNLVENGLKFHRPEVPPRVQVEARVEDGWCEISVRDNGIGFDENRLHEIFQVFGRLNPRQEYGGAGFGLTICQCVAEHHGGTIRASSRPGEGSTFVAMIPCPSATRDPDAD